MKTANDNNTVQATKKVLLFTTVEKVGYNSSIKTEQEELTEEFKALIATEYGFNRETMLHSSIYASEAMNGDELYIEIVSENKELLEQIESRINQANISTRYQLEQWVKQQSFRLLESEGDIDQYDEYLLEVN